MSYRTAEQARWRQFDFVVGYEIKLSQSHPCEDVCDELAGKYPKDFVWTGWHPNDLCYCVSILKTDDEFWRDLESGEESGSSNEITDVPEAFKEWISENADRIEAARERGTEPYFIRDNKQYVDKTINNVGYRSVFSNDNRPLTLTEILDISKIQTTLENLVKQNSSWFKRGFVGIETRATSSGGYMSTTLDGKISVNFAEDRNGFNAGKSLVSAFNKIGKSISLNRHEEYSIEVLWHEILHNKSANTAILPPINSPLGFTRTVAETINQLVARYSYPSFLSKLGGKSLHQQWIIENGYGYQATVRNLRSIITSTGIDERKFVAKAERILMKDYTDIDKKVKSLLFKEYSRIGGYKNINRIFDFIEHQNFSTIIKSLL